MAIFFNKDVNLEMQAATIEVLNHACVIIDIEDVSIICDPWLIGTCFGAQWGLRYENARAFEQINRCTHMWISHVHGDHLHLSTLKLIYEKQPNIGVLVNRSANIDMLPWLQKIGFKNQYAGSNLKTILSQNEFVGSISRKGDCWDNAVAEVFPHTLKVEFIHRHTFRTRDEVKK